MSKVIKILTVILGIILFTTLFASSLYTDTIECDNNTIIVSVCTGDMRALETGISVYAGYNKIPLILSDKTMPEQLDAWLPGYIEKNNITKIIVVGPVRAEQLFNFLKLGVNVNQVTGQNIPEILTKIAKNSKEIRNDSIILTASDPLAGELGAYMKIPVFVTASNSTYISSENLDEKYWDYINENNISKVIIVGNLPESIKNQLKENNIKIEELSGENSLEVSKNVNNKLFKEGYLNNSKIAYYGFYGELPTIIPSVIKNNAMLIEDSSNTGNITPYLSENNISIVVITRNTKSDYIQMEETDYVSDNILNDLQKFGINIKYLTKQRTLDEATGLYDMKILTAENLGLSNQITYEELNDTIVKTEPPLIAILNSTYVEDSNNISAQIKQINGGYEVKWNTIHPYFWKKINDNEYKVTSNTGYDYSWKKVGNKWIVNYYLDNETYYNITWQENDDNSWTEIQDNINYIWKYDGINWKCYNQNNKIIYYISKQ